MEVNLSNVYFSYDDNKLFSDFSCCFKDNFISSIVGSNGSGKSTLLDLIDGLLTPISGSVKVGDINIDSCRKRVGYLFHNSLSNFIEFQSSYGEYNQIPN